MNIFRRVLLGVTAMQMFLLPPLQAKEVRICPPWTVLVLDENGKPKADCEVTQDWEFVGLPETRGNEAKRTDQDGRVVFPARTAKVTTKEYLTSKVGEGLNVHGGFGPLVHVEPDVRDYKRAGFSSWDGGETNDSINPGCGKTLKGRDGLLSTFRLLPADLLDLIDAAEWEKAAKILKGNPKLATVSNAWFGTPLHGLAERWWSGSAHAKQLELAQLLIDSGANVNAKAPNGTTPLHVAARHTAVQLVELLLANGADPNAKVNTDMMGGESSSTPLHYLVWNMEHERDADKIRIIDLLAQHGADMNAPSTSGLPLMKAAVLENPPVIEALLSHGADPSRLGSDGKTPLDYANIFNRTEVAKLLADAVAQKKKPVP